MIGKKILLAQVKVPKTFYANSEHFPNGIGFLGVQESGFAVIQGGHLLFNFLKEGLGEKYSLFRKIKTPLKESWRYITYNYEVKFKKQIPTNFPILLRIEVGKKRIMHKKLVGRLDFTFSQGDAKGSLDYMINLTKGGDNYRKK